jgi:hypothetical protein
MADDSPEGMPEFDKPESIPLVVPDHQYEVPRIKTPSKRCTAKTKLGKDCKTPALRDHPFCIAHTPTISEEQRTTWRKLPRGHGIKQTIRDLRFRMRTPSEVIRYAEIALNEIDEKYGTSNLATGDLRIWLMRVCLAAQKELREQALITIPEKKDRSIEIVERVAEQA